jgi:hypothetical protein
VPVKKLVVMVLPEILQDRGTNFKGQGVKPLGNKIQELGLPPASYPALLQNPVDGKWLEFPRDYGGSKEELWKKER